MLTMIGIGAPAPVAGRARAVRPLAVAASVLLSLTSACGGSTSGSGAVPQDPPPPRQPLGAWATQPVALLPAQYLRGGDPGGWAERLGTTRDFLRALDAALAAELAARATARAWTLPEALAGMARRNPAFTPDPYALAAEGLRAGVRRTTPNLGEPLATQIRALIALTDARYAVVPVEVRFISALPADSGTRAVLRVALLDGRLSQVQWAGDVATDPVTAPDRAAVAAGLAARFADLFAPP